MSDFLNNWSWLIIDWIKDTFLFLKIFLGMMIEPVKIINQRMLAYIDFKCLSQTTINDGNGNLRITIECFSKYS